MLKAYQFEISATNRFFFPWFRSINWFFFSQMQMKTHLMFIFSFVFFQFEKKIVFCFSVKCIAMDFQTLFKSVKTYSSS